MVSNLVAALKLVLTPQSLVVIPLGIVMGQILGAIPGLTGMMAIALLMPMTYYMDPVPSLLLLIAISKGALFGGALPSILINTPGTPAAAATAIDGYQLALKGKSMKAAKMALYASVSADTFSDIVLLFVAPPLASLALKFGPPEYASLIVFSFTIIAAVSGTSILKGVIAALIGVIIACIGVDPIAGIPRFMFGRVELYEGVPLLPMMIGIFALSEAFTQFGKKSLRSATETFLPISHDPDDNRVTRGEFKRSAKHILRASVIGTFLGAVPGIGPTISAFVSYSEAQRTSPNRAEFGHGAIEGVAAAEAGNSAVSGANLIPLLSLGVPGDATAAVLLGAFMVHGISPGPMLFQKHATIMYAFFLGLILCNLANLVFGHVLIHVSRRICTFRKALVLPVIVTLCCVGAYAVNSSMFDVKLMFAFGLLGYIMTRMRLPIAPLVIGFVLQPLAESSIRQTLIISGGRVAPFFTRPISILFMILTVLSVVFAVVRSRQKTQDPRLVEEG